MMLDSRKDAEDKEPILEKSKVNIGGRPLLQDEARGEGGAIELGKYSSEYHDDRASKSERLWVR